VPVPVGAERWATTALGKRGRPPGVGSAAPAGLPPDKGAALPTPRARTVPVLSR